MIVFRHADPRFPFLWEDASQPPGRWHGEGEGPAHYLADTPDAAWAEFLRHEEITDPVDVRYVRRAMWAIETPDEELARPALPPGTLTGGRGTYPRCQAEARRIRAAGATGIRAPSAAVLPGGAAGWRVDGGLRPAALRDGTVLVLFGRRPQVTGWAAAIEGRPREDLVSRVRQFPRARSR